MSDFARAPVLILLAALLVAAAVSPVRAQVTAADRVLDREIDLLLLRSNGTGGESTSDTVPIVLDATRPRRERDRVTFKGAPPGADRPSTVASPRESVRPFEAGSITVGPENRTFTSRPFGNGTITTGPPGQVWTTRPFGNGTLTTGPDGKTFTTRPFGNGTITTGPRGQTWTTRPFGNGTLTTGPDGKTFTTRPFGNGSVTTGPGGQTWITRPFGSGSGTTTSRSAR